MRMKNCVLSLYFYLNKVTKSCWWWPVERPKRVHEPLSLTHLMVTNPGWKTQHYLNVLLVTHENVLTILRLYYQYRHRLHVITNSQLLLLQSSRCGIGGLFTRVVTCFNAFLYAISAGNTILQYDLQITGK